jgi:hypothetical protein
MKQMKFKLFYHSESIGYLQVEEDVYEERIVPEIIGLEINNTVSIEEKQKISEYCNSMGLWHIANLVYFDSEEDRIQFLLTWG